MHRPPCRPSNSFFPALRLSPTWVSAGPPPPFFRAGFAPPPCPPPQPLSPRIFPSKNGIPAPPSIKQNPFPLFCWAWWDAQQPLSAPKRGVRRAGLVVRQYAKMQAPRGVGPPTALLVKVICSIVVAPPLVLRALLPGNRALGNNAGAMPGVVENRGGDVPPLGGGCLAFRLSKGPPRFYPP